MAKCNQKLCQRTKNIGSSGTCSVCDEVIKNVEAKHKKVDEKKTVKRVELDIKHMVEINEKLSKGLKIDYHVVSNLLLSGIINIIEQNKTVEELEQKIKHLEHSDITTKAKLEALENWVLKQDDNIHQLDELLSVMDKNGAVVKESNQIKELARKVSDVETNLRQVRSTTKKINKSEVNDEQVSKSMKCKECNDEFTRNCDLEAHLEGHKREKEFKCEVCGKGFYLNWRLRRHKEVHQTQSNARFCHYFNNSKPCPYEDIGCMFIHSKAGKCKVASCSFSLCQFEHDDKKIEEIETVASEDSELDEDVDEYEGDKLDNSSSVSYGENDCHLCEWKFMCMDDLLEHFRFYHQEYYQESQEGAANYLASQNEC